MNILAIETSCDDTCAAILKIKNKKSKIKNFEILSNIVSSQVKLHAKYGGVYPFLAKREHQKNLPIVFQKALKEAGSPKINLMAITAGPGLEPCLWVGVNFAKELAKKLQLPIIPINHIEAHILANFINNREDAKCQLQDFLPAVCLVVSGGHTQLVLMKKIGVYKILGETRDDAAGECFDKIARILGLGYPGGPIISRTAQSVIVRGSTSIKLPRPMIYQKNYDFSFSGLKTAVLYEVRSMKYEETKKKRFIQAMCSESQQAIIDVLIRKTLKVAKNYKVKTIILGGGVAANKELRKQFQQRIEKEMPNAKYLMPDTKYCTDNAAMVAVAAYFNRFKRKSWKEIKANANLKIGEKL